MSTPEAEALRARALVLAGEEQRAAELFEKAEQTESALEAAWRGGDWDRVARLGAPAQQAAAEIAAEPLAMPEGQIRLADARGMLARSAGARSVLGELLVGGAGE